MNLLRESKVYPFNQLIKFVIRDTLLRHVIAVDFGQ